MTADAEAPRDLTQQRNVIWRGHGERKSTRPQDTYKLMTRDPFRGRKEVLSHTVLLKFEHGGVNDYNLEIDLFQSKVHPAIKIN